MKQIFIVLGIATVLAGCETQGQSAAAGGLAGAAIGAAVAGEDETGGAVKGAVVGAIAGALIGKASEPNKCRYRYPDGTEYVADCP